MGFLFRKRNNNIDELTENVLQAQAGNNEVREWLLEQYTPFILRVASSFCNRYLVMGKDDEISIGLIAFNEAIDKYSDDKGANFLTFAEVVIKRRLTDFYRKENKFREKVIPLTTLRDEDNQELEQLVEVAEAQKNYQIQQESLDKKEEIIHFAKMLSEFKISMNDLVQVSPKHFDARCRAYKVAEIIVENKFINDLLWEKKTLPLKKLEKEVNISRKTLERQRKYIIALVIILQGNYEYLKSYITELERREDFG